jgi:hypothetical protein
MYKLNKKSQTNTRQDRTVAQDLSSSCEIEKSVCTRGLPCGWSGVWCEEASKQAIGKLFIIVNKKPPCVLIFQVKNEMFAQLQLDQQKTEIFSTLRFEGDRF